MTLGQKIRYYREKQGLGQEHLAWLSHISVSTIRKYESGERNPKDDQLEKLAHALHISTSMLRDYNLNSCSDILPVLYEIGNKYGIIFNGVKDEQGKFIPDTISIKFSNEKLMAFFLEWADKVEELNGAKEASKYIKDPVTNDIMVNRINELERELESDIVLKNTVFDQYINEDITKYDGSIFDSLNAPVFDKYSQVLDVLSRIARSSILFDCLGVWERVWEGKAIFTFRFDSIQQLPENGKLFSEFLYYFNGFSQKDINTDCYAYEEDGFKYYRYIIFDRTLATGINIIRDVLEHKENGFFDEKSDVVDLFNKNVKTKIKTYDISIK